MRRGYEDKAVRPAGDKTPAADPDYRRRLEALDPAARRKLQENRWPARGEATDGDAAEA